MHALGKLENSESKACVYIKKILAPMFSIPVVPGSVGVGGGKC